MTQLPVTTNHFLTLMIAALVLAIVVLVGLLYLVGRIFEAMDGFERYQDDTYSLGTEPDRSQTWSMEVENA